MLPAIIRTFKAACLAAILVILAASSSFSATILHGFTFEDDAFADVLLSDPSGLMVSGAPDAETALTGSDTSSFAYSAVDGSFITLGFTDNVVLNGPGADLIVFELNIITAEPIVLTINGFQSAPMAQSSAVATFPPDGTIHFTAWDLSDFGIAIGASVDTVTLQGVCTAAVSAVHGCTEDALVASAFLAVGALNSGPAVSPIPLPATGITLFLGLLLLLGLRSKQLNKLRARQAARG